MNRIIFAAFAVVFLSTSIGLAAAGDLTSNIMRRVNAANLSLDKVSEMVDLGKAELSDGELNNAIKEFDNIHQYYGGTFDPNHPTLLNLKARIEELKAKAKGAEATAEAPAKTTAEPKIRKKAEKMPTATATQNGGQPKEISANIRRRMKTIEMEIKSVEQLTAKGQDASASVAAARQEFRNIHEYYKGSFDPNHPELVALESRINDAEKSMNASVAIKEMTTPVESRMNISGIPGQIGKDLMQVGSALRSMEQRLETAYQGSNPGSYYPNIRSDLEFAEKKFAEFNGRHADRYDPGHEAYLQVTKRIEDGRAAASKLKREDGAAQTAANQAARAKYEAEANAIMGRHKNQAPTSKLHAANVGRMVWATREVSFKEQDSIEPRDRFKLADPIFSRVYLPRSLGNTPIYGSDGGKPSENSEFGYEFRLFIDGQELVDKFGAFSKSKLNDEAGRSWTTWQFAPNPVPFDENFKKEAEAWRRVTRVLTPGEHKVRFELWGRQGQFKSGEPVSVGEFTLLVSKGDRVAAVAPFPRDRHKGGDVNAIRSDIAKALVGPVAKSKDEFLKIAVTSDWKEGIYSDTKRRYRSVSGAVLSRDTDDDGVCRFVTYNFVSNHLGGSDWTPVKFKSFCLSCPEGDAECPK